jgi:hypothetical protein
MMRKPLLDAKHSFSANNRRRKADFATRPRAAAEWPRRWRTTEDLGCEV